MFLYGDKKIREILIKHINIEEELVHLLCNREIKIEDILEKISNMNKLREETINNFIRGKNLQINLDDGQIWKNLDILKNLQNQDINPILDDLEKEINKLSENTIVTFNFSHIINLMEKMGRKINLDGYKGKLVILNDKTENIPLILQNGKKILLTMEYFDLSPFTVEELLEILRFLDVNIDDNRYDLLKNEIIKYLSHISKISIL